jgi:hypothetical protein
MSKHAKIYGVIALVAVIIFLMAACNRSGERVAPSDAAAEPDDMDLLADPFEFEMIGRGNGKQFSFKYNIPGKSSAPGTVRLTSPSVYAGNFTPVKFNPLAAGESVKLDIPYYVAGLLTFELELEDGNKYSYVAKYDVAYAERSRPVGGVNPAKNTSLPAFVMDTIDYVRPNTGPLIWDGPESLSVTSTFAWDNNNLYVYAVVIDPDHFNDKTGENIWNGDCLQLGIDLTRASLANNARNELGFALHGNGSISMYRWATPRGLTEQNLSAITAKITRDEATKTTIYDLSIPFAVVHRDPASLDLSMIGVSVFINDATNGVRTQEIEVESGHLKESRLFTTLYLLNSAADYKALIGESAQGAIDKAIASNAIHDIYMGYNFLRLGR